MRANVEMSTAGQLDVVINPYTAELPPKALRQITDGSIDLELGGTRIRAFDTPDK